MTINEKISLFFRNKGVNQKEIAAANNVEASTVSHWFTGKRAMPLSLLVWAVEEHQLDASSLFEKDIPTVVAEVKAKYNVGNKDLEPILTDIEKVLKKHLKS